MGSLSVEVRTEVLCGRICDLEAENAELWEQNDKLHMLLRSVLVLRHDTVYKWLDATIAEIYGKSFTEQAQELGVEVDE